MNDHPSGQPESPAALLTIPEVAGASGLSEKSIRRAIERGDLRAMKICNRMRIAREDMAAWYKRCIVAVDERQPTMQHAQTQPYRRTRRSRDAIPGGLREMLGNSSEESAA